MHIALEAKCASIGNDRWERIYGQSFMRHLIFSSFSVQLVNISNDFRGTNTYKLHYIKINKDNSFERAKILNALAHDLNLKLINRHETDYRKRTP